MYKLLTCIFSLLGESTEKYPSSYKFSTYTLAPASSLYPMSLYICSFFILYFPLLKIIVVFNLFPKSLNSHATLPILSMFKSVRTVLSSKPSILYVCLNSEYIFLINDTSYKSFNCTIIILLTPYFKLLNSILKYYRSNYNQCCNT